MKLTRLGPSSVDSNSEGAYFQKAPGTPTINGDEVSVPASEVVYKGVAIAINAATLSFAFAAEGFKRKDIIVARYTSPLGYYIISGQEVAESGAAIAPAVPFNRLMVSDLDVNDNTVTVGGLQEKFYRSEEVTPGRTATHEISLDFRPTEYGGPRMTSGYEDLTASPGRIFSGTVAATPSFVDVITYMQAEITDYIQGTISEAAVLVAADPVDPANRKVLIRVTSNEDGTFKNTVFEVRADGLYLNGAPFTGGGGDTTDVDAYLKALPGHAANKSFITDAEGNTVWGEGIDSSLTQRVTNVENVIEDQINSNLTVLNDTIASIMAIIGPQAGDGDAVVNTVREMLLVFQNYTEGVDLSTQLNTLVANLANKVDKVPGKGLSTNDYDTTAKGKVDRFDYNELANKPIIPTTPTGVKFTTPPSASVVVTTNGTGIVIPEAQSVVDDNGTSKTIPAQTLNAVFSTTGKQRGIEIVVNYTGTTRLYEIVDGGTASEVPEGTSVSFPATPSNRLHVRYLIVTDSNGLVSTSSGTVVANTFGTSTTAVYSQNYFNSRVHRQDAAIQYLSQYDYADITYQITTGTTPSTITIQTPVVFGSITTVTYQLFIGNTGGTIRTTLTDINTDLAALTATEKNTGIRVRVKGNGAGSIYFKSQLS